MEFTKLTDNDRLFIKETANNIFKCLKSPNFWVFGSWGAHDFIATLYKGMASLQFKVNGFICKGRVIVAYNEGTDLYEVYTFNRLGNPMKSVTDVYFDQLQEVVDHLVETKNDQSDDYKQQTADWLNKAVLN